MDPLIHTCHAKLCDVPCPPEYLMCPVHWAKVPGRLQRAVWGAYRPGQCDDKSPSRAWFVAAEVAIDHVAVLEEAEREAKLRDRGPLFEGVDDEEDGSFW